MNWEHNIEQQDREEHGEYLAGLNAEGAADAALGYSPQCKEDVYLTAYFKTLRERVEQGETLEIKVKSSKTHFSFGYDDNSHYVNYSEEF